MGSSPLAPEIKVQITGKDTGVNLAIAELRTQLTQLKAAQDATASSAQRMGAAERGAAVNITEARGAAKLLSQEVGVNLNRHLTSVLANSKVLGPLLQTAFPIAAAIGFGAVIMSFAEKFSTLIADTFIFTNAMKEEYAAQVQTNKEIAKAAEEIAKLKKAYDLIGLKGSDLGAAKLADLRKQIVDATAAFQKLQAQPVAAPPPTGIAQEYFLGEGMLKKGAGALLDTDLGQPDLSVGADAKARQMGAVQEQMRLLKQQLANEEKQNDQTIADEKISAAGKLRSQQETLSRANLSSIRGALQGELELYKATDANEEQENQISFDRGLESLAQYFAKRKELAAAEAQKEIDTLQAQRTAEAAAGAKAIAGFNKEIATVAANKGDTSALTGQRDAAAIENRTKLADLDNKIAVARVTAGTKQAQLDDEQSKKQEELDQKTLEFQAQIAKAQGARFDEASERIDAEAAKMAQTLRQAGLSPEQVDAMVAKFKSAETQRAQFASMKTGGQNAIADLSSEEEDIRLKNSAIVADVKIAALERARIPVLQQLAAQMKAAAGTPDEVRQADDYAKNVDHIAIAAQKSQVSMKNFGDQAFQAIGRDLTTFLGSTINQVHGVGDAFAKLAESAVASIQQIIAQLLVQIAMQELAQALGLSGGGGAGGGLLSFLPVASGGLISGPGGPTSDTIPAMLSPGEFVVRASAVQDFGLHNLAAINAGANIPAIRGLGGIPQFAQGGLVTAGRSSDGFDVRMGIGLDEGLILKHLSSKKAGRIIVQHLSANSKAAQRALSRSD